MSDDIKRQVAMFAVSKWIDEHPKCRLISPGQIEHWSGIPKKQLIAALDTSALSKKWAFDNGVLLEPYYDSPEQPNVEWIRGRLDEKVHTDDCEYVPVYFREPPANA